MATPLTVNLSINGAAPQALSVADGTQPLLYVLRNQLGLHGPKFGCGVAQCGACTVQVNGAITRSCVTPMNTLPAGAQVITLEGLTGNSSDPFSSNGGSALQQAFIDQQAAQCGYCANSMIMGAYTWLRTRIAAGLTGAPSDDEVKNFLSGVGQSPAYVYLCRCGTHLRIIRAIQQAAGEMS